MSAFALRYTIAKRAKNGARTFMEKTYLFPDQREAVIADYRYSLEVASYRSLLQVTNLEALRELKNPNTRN